MLHSDFKLQAAIYHSQIMSQTVSYDRFLLHSVKKIMKMLAKIYGLNLARRKRINSPLWPNTVSTGDEMAKMHNQPSPAISLLAVALKDIHLR